MKFTNEHKILSSINKDSMLEIKYNFHNSVIKIMYNHNWSFLTVIFECPDITLIQDYKFEFRDNQVFIIGALSKENYNRASDILSATGTLSEFNNSLRASISAVIIKSDKFVVKFYKFTGTKLKAFITYKLNADKAIYFNHIRRTSISNKHFDKVVSLLGEPYARFLAIRGLTAVFVEDKSRAKEFFIQGL